MTTVGKLMTAEELEQLPDDGRRYELLDGVLHEMPPTSWIHDEVRTLVAIVFGGYVLEHKLGYVLTGDTGFSLQRDPDRLRGAGPEFRCAWPSAWRPAPSKLFDDYSRSGH